MNEMFKNMRTKRLHCFAEIQRLTEGLKSEEIEFYMQLAKDLDPKVKRFVMEEGIFEALLRSGAGGAVLNVNDQYGFESMESIRKSVMVLETKLGPEVEINFIGLGSGLQLIFTLK